MTLIRTNLEILAQLNKLLTQFNNVEYTMQLSVLSNNTIGKHVRHILEFYECLLKGLHQAEVNYDKRERNLALETDISYTLKMIESISSAIEQQKTDLPLQLIQEYSTNDELKVNSTYYRELVYNIEHAIHHFAILSIAQKAHFPHIQIPENFGTAYSTIQYQANQCAQ